MLRSPTPAEIHAAHIAKAIGTLARRMDGSASETTQAHAELLEAVRTAPSGTDRNWLACESILEAMRQATRDRLAIGAVLVACEEARDAICRY